MKKQFSRSWIKSRQPRKQRKYQAKAPLHLRNNFVQVHLSKEYRHQVKRRTFNVRKGDKVRVVRGQFKGKEGKVERVSTTGPKGPRLYITGVEMSKIDGSKAQYPVHPSNVVLEQVVLEDKKRKQKFESKQEG